MAKNDLVKNFVRHPPSGEKELPVAIVMQRTGRGIGKIKIDYGNRRSKSAGLINTAVYKTARKYSGFVYIYEKPRDSKPGQTIEFGVTVNRASPVKHIKKISQMGDYAYWYSGMPTAFKIILAGNLTANKLKEVKWSINGGRKVSTGKSLKWYTTIHRTGPTKVTAHITTWGLGPDSKSCKILVLSKSYKKIKKGNKVIIK